MAVITQAEVNLAVIKDIKSYTRYYILQSSDLDAPAKPTTLTVPSPWSAQEPSYDGTKTALYYIDEICYSDGSFAYSDVSRSSQMDALCDLSDIVDGMGDDVDALKTSVRQTSEAITQKADEIQASVSDKYVTKDSLTSTQADINSTISQTGDDIRLDFTQMLETLQGQVSDHQTHLEEYIQMEDGTITLGQAGSSMTTELSDSALSFKQNGMAVTYISDNAAQITNAVITQKLSIGNFDVIPKSGGNLSVKWRGKS